MQSSSARQVSEKKGGDVCKREEESQGHECAGRQPHEHKAEMKRADRCAFSVHERNLVGAIEVIQDVQAVVDRGLLCFPCFR